MASPGRVSVQDANHIHQLLLSDPAFYWEGGEDGCYARALLMADRMAREGLPNMERKSLCTIGSGSCPTGPQIRFRPDLKRPHAGE